MDKYVSADRFKSALMADMAKAALLNEYITAIDSGEYEVHGKWESIGYRQYICTNCRNHITDTRWNYCPCCGADMREAEEYV